MAHSIWGHILLAFEPAWVLLVFGHLHERGHSIGTGTQVQVFWVNKKIRP